MIKYSKPAWLRLDRVSVTDAGLAELASQKQLEYVAIWYTPVSDKAVATLSEWKRLKHILLFGTKISTASANDLAQKLPGTIVDYKKGGLLGVRGGGLVFGQHFEGCPVEPSPDGAAFKAGIRNNDIIVSFDNHKVTKFDDLRDAIATKAAGETAVVEFYHQNKLMKRTVTLGEWDRTPRK